MNNEEIEKMYEKGIVSLSKILEPLIEKFIQDKNSVDIQQCQLIIHYLIEERKFDENYVDELEKEIEDKKEEIYAIAKTNYTVGMLDERSQWYKKINEKIEYIEKEMEKDEVDEFGIHSQGWLALDWFVDNLKELIGKEE